MRFPLERRLRWRHNLESRSDSTPRAPTPFLPVPLPVPRSPVIRGDVPLSAIDARAWNALAPAHPFLSHAFFAALHETGGASRETGWQARCVTAWIRGVLVGAMPVCAES